jgi:Zn-dependent protease
LVRDVSSKVSPLFLLLIAVTIGGAVLSALQNDIALTAGVVVLVLGGWAVSLCLHEFGHAAVAYRGGDTSVRAKGYLTLDIRRYTDPMFSLVLPVIFLLVGGIPLPGGAVWINQHAIRSRPMQSLVSLTGPLVNLLLAFVLVAVVALVPLPLGPTIGLSCLALIQVLAFVLNILPVPGLDGFGVIEPYLSEPTRRFAARVRPWAPLVLFLLIIGLPGLSALLFQLGGALFVMLGGDPEAANAGYRELLFWRF